MSLASETEMMRRGSTMVFPQEPTFEGYRRVFNQTVIFTNALTVSVMRTVIGTLITLFMTIITGYALSKKDLPGQKALLVIVMIIILYSGGLIPTFLTVASVGLLESFWSMIIPGMVDAWGVLVFKQFFTNLPREIEESAYIDGANEVTLMTKIVLPMSLPVIAAMSLFIAVGHWNSWFDALIYIRDPAGHPLQLLLRNMFVNASIGYDMGMNIVQDVTMRVSAISIRMVIAVLGTVPILCVYPFLQKYFVKGVYVGAVKE